MNYKKIGKAIKERMVELNISEDKLANECSLDLNLVNNLIIGEEVASIKELTLIAIYLDMSFNDLLDTKSNKTYYIDTLKSTLKKRKKRWSINLAGALCLCLILCIIEAKFMVIEIPLKFGIIVTILIVVMLLIIDICKSLTAK